MKKVEIDFTPYYEWYAKWINWEKVSINDFINGKSKICQPYSPNLKLRDICKIVWKSL